ncbi:MAG: hypothetical protein QNJ74_04135 [Trichodesmium sp. MO_231.B1]|nr:hypothetical protein [Trichodesmium sp. MO_231.B1]
MLVTYPTPHFPYSLRPTTEYLAKNKQLNVIKEEVRIKKEEIKEEVA